MLQAGGCRGANSELLGVAETLSLLSHSAAWVDLEVRRFTQRGGKVQAGRPYVAFLLLYEHGNHSAAFHQSQRS